MIYVTLTPDELAHDEEMALRRNEQKRRRGIQRNGTYDGKPSIDVMHLEGNHADRAVAKLIGATVDERDYPAGQRLGNLILPNGTRAISRYRKLQDWIFGLKSTNEEDFFGLFGFLVHYGRGQNVLCVRSWIARFEFLEHAYVGNFGHGDHLVIDHAWMHPIETWPTLVPQPSPPQPEPPSRPEPAPRPQMALL